MGGDGGDGGDGGGDGGIGGDGSGGIGSDAGASASVGDSGIGGGDSGIGSDAGASASVGDTSGVDAPADSSGISVGYGSIGEATAPAADTSDESGVSLGVSALGAQADAQSAMDDMAAQYGIATDPSMTSPSLTATIDAAMTAFGYPTAAQQNEQSAINAVNQEAMPSFALPPSPPPTEQEAPTEQAPTEEQQAPLSLAPTTAPNLSLPGINLAATPTATTSVFGQPTSQDSEVGNAATAAAQDTSAATGLTSGIPGVGAFGSSLGIGTVGPATGIATSADPGFGNIAGIATPAGQMGFTSSNATSVDADIASLPSDVAAALGTLSNTPADPSTAQAPVATFGFAGVPGVGAFGNSLGIGNLGTTSGVPGALGTVGQEGIDADQSMATAISSNLSPQESPNQTVAAEFAQLPPSLESQLNETLSTINAILGTPAQPAATPTSPQTSQNTLTAQDIAITDPNAPQTAQPTLSPQMATAIFGPPVTSQTFANPQIPAPTLTSPMQQAIDQAQANLAAQHNQPAPPPAPVTAPQAPVTAPVAAPQAPVAAPVATAPAPVAAAPVAAATPAATAPATTAGQIGINLGFSPGQNIAGVGFGAGIGNVVGVTPEGPVVATTVQTPLGPVQQTVVLPWYALTPQQMTQLQMGR